MKRKCTTVSHLIRIVSSHFLLQQRSPGSANWCATIKSLSQPPRARESTDTPDNSSISAYPTVTFVVIINPHNGPGASSQPDAAYSREIGQLNSLPNVRLVGYVRINYCERDLAEVHEDVNKYAGWSTLTSSDSAQMSLAVHGIFFDETPNLYTEERANYLGDVTKLVKNSSGILGDRVVSRSSTFSCFLLCRVSKLSYDIPIRPPLFPSFAHD